MEDGLGTPQQGRRPGLSIALTCLGSSPMASAQWEHWLPAKRRGPHLTPQLRASSRETLSEPSSPHIHASWEEALSILGSTQAAAQKTSQDGLTRMFQDIRTSMYKASLD
jgi:hypothetical protein